MQTIASQSPALASALATISDTNEFSSNPRLQEHFAVTLYRYFQDDAQDSQYIAALLPRLKHQLQQLACQEVTLANDYALWESLRAAGFLYYRSSRDNTSALAQVLLSSQLDQALLHIAQVNGVRHGQDWVKQNAYWAIAQYRLSLPSNQDGSSSDAKTAIDAKVAQIAAEDVNQRGLAAKQAYTLGYHVNIFGRKARCEQQANICHIPDISEVLPIRHQCNERLSIVTQALSREQMLSSCQTLEQQELGFHRLLQTQSVAVANDFNQTLELVIFDNWSQYNAYGQLIFDIDTDNGGMYIEGQPAKPGNQARFFAFRQWWVEPEFAIWNLAHEYVHYLDGRFVKYGGFEHFPSKQVWWSEGLAEYVAKGNHNPVTLSFAQKQWQQGLNAGQQTLDDDIEAIPDLATIFATEYADGQARTYKWSYLAIRFLAEHHPQQLVNLSQFLKTDYFQGYEQLLAELTQYQSQYQSWLTTLLEDAPKSSLSPATTLKPNRIARYAYRDYLIPSHLPSVTKHWYL
ncbi:collagenase [Shewanella sp. NIFS-20-20]|nr:collagenase [Shewanella sp. NIFS-20-20]